MTLPMFFAACAGSAPKDDTDSGIAALYGKYASGDDLKAARLDGFKIADTVRVDVVMLQADADEAWQRLVAEFDIRGNEGTVSWLGQVDNPATRTIWDGQPVVRVIASHSRHTVGFFLVENETQYDALIDYQLNRTKEQETK